MGLESNPNDALTGEGTQETRGKTTCEDEAVNGATSKESQSRCSKQLEAVPRAWMEHSPINVPFQILAPRVISLVLSHPGCHTLFW